MKRPDFFRFGVSNAYNLPHRAEPINAQEAAARTHYGHRATVQPHTAGG